MRGQRHTHTHVPNPPCNMEGKRVPWSTPHEFLMASSGFQSYPELMAPILHPDSSYTPDMMTPTAMAETTNRTLQTLNIWHSRAPSLPSSLEVSRLLLMALTLDQSGALDPSPIYALAIVRGVNTLTDPHQTSIASSVSAIASKIGMPTWLVDIRHDISHNTIPQLPLLRLAAVEMSSFLIKSYWVPVSNGYESIISEAKSHLDRYDGERTADNARMYARNADPAVATDMCLAYMQGEEYERVKLLITAMQRRYDLFTASLIAARPDWGELLGCRGWVGLFFPEYGKRNGVDLVRKSGRKRDEGEEKWLREIVVVEEMGLDGTAGRGGPGVEGGELEEGGELSLEEMERLANEDDAEEDAVYDEGDMEDGSEMMVKVRRVIGR